MRAVLVAAFLIFSFTPPANAEPTPSPAPSTSEGAGTGTTPDGLSVFGEQAAAETASEPTSSTESIGSVDDGSPGTWHATEACQTVSNSGCVEAYRCPDGALPIVWLFVSPSGTVLDSYSQCPAAPPPPGASAPVAVSAQQVLRRFREIPMPESTLTVQPPGGKTLVNFETIFSTTAEPFTRTVTFFGGRIVVDLAIAPSQFTWNHGDGTTQASDWPGKAWSAGAHVSDLITHTYTAAEEDLAAHVDTTWSATWTMNGRDMGAVDGTVTKTGSPVALDILEAKPKLVR